MNLLNFIRKNINRTIPDFSDVGVDMHSHLIPGIDDGVTTIEEAVEIVKQLHKLGYYKLITTPHIMSDFYKNTPEIINSGLKLLQNEIRKQNISVTIEAAAEYYLDYEFEKKLEKENLMTFGKKYILIEISFFNPLDSLHEIIFNLETAGYKPILAHPERYTYWLYDFNKYIELKDRGVLFQINVNSLIGEYSLQAKKIAEKLIENNMVEFLGTDVHFMMHVELMNKLLSNKHLAKLVYSGNLLNNTL
ncbi:MAG: capsular biosynthesis protein [Bacteroidales bacterium]|nr:capsular biosynthesis protein [Bacteroidales bacterium]